MNDRVRRHRLSLVNLRAKIDLASAARKSTPSIPLKGKFHANRLGRWYNSGLLSHSHFMEVMMSHSSSSTLAEGWLRIWQMGMLQFQDWINFMGPFTVGGMFNTVNINSRSSADPDAEADVTTNVASYGRQLGRISEALSVVLAQSNLPQLSESQSNAVYDFQKLVRDIEDVKLAHRAKRLGMSVTDMLAAEKK
jgi:hypothetical protein